jgi:hypothetical protein
MGRKASGASGFSSSHTGPFAYRFGARRHRGAGPRTDLLVFRCCAEREVHGELLDGTTSGTSRFRRPVLRRVDAVSCNGAVKYAPHFRGYGGVHLKVNGGLGGECALTIHGTLRRRSWRAGCRRWGTCAF